MVKTNPKPKFYFTTNNQVLMWERDLLSEITDADLASISMYILWMVYYRHYNSWMKSCWFKPLAIIDPFEQVNSRILGNALYASAL